MITSVRESKARLSELVTRAVAGEEVVITVRGKPTARLVAIQSTKSKPDRSDWIADLRRHQQTQSKRRRSTPTEDLVGLLREDRT